MRALEVSRRDTTDAVDEYAWWQLIAEHVEYAQVAFVGLEAVAERASVGLLLLDESGGVVEASA